MTSYADRIENMQPNAPERVPGDRKHLPVLLALEGGVECPDYSFGFDQVAARE